MSEEEQDALRKPVILEESEIRSILGYQQDRFNHIQSLSRGFLGIAFALATIVATLFASSVVLFPAFPSASYLSSNTPVELFMFSMGTQLATWLLAMNFLIGYMLMILGGTTTIGAISKFIDIILKEPINIGLIESDEHSLALHHSGSWSFASKEVKPELHELAHTNSEQLNTIIGDFRIGALRIIGAFFLLLGGISILHLSADLKLYGLLLVNVYWSLPFHRSQRAIRGFFAAVTGIDSREFDESDRIYLNLFGLEVDESEWGLLEGGRIEKILTEIVVLLSHLAVGGYILASVYDVAIMLV